MAGRSTRLRVLAEDDGGAAALRYTWSAAGPFAVVFEPNGTGAARTPLATFSRAGSYLLTVTVEDASALTAVSTVEVAVAATLTEVRISPADAQVGADRTHPFTAAAVDQFGDSMAVAPTAVWAVSGGGTIDEHGVFRARRRPGGPFVINATLGELKGSAVVEVVPSALPGLVRGEIEGCGASTAPTAAAVLALACLPLLRRRRRSARDGLHWRASWRSIER